MPEPIAIVGIGCRLPGGVDSPQSFWELLREGREVITEIPADRWDLGLHYHPDPSHPLTQHVQRGGFVEGIDQFDAAFFGISPREAVCMDPQQRLLLEVAWRALEDAGQPLEALQRREIGVFMGISSADYSALLWASKERFVTPNNEPFVLPGNTGCIAANRLSYFFDFKGPSFTVDTACSSSLVAVHLACESLWRGESEAALAGGVQALIHPGIQMSFCKAGLLAPDGRCKSFDASADGYGRSEGAGVVVLKPLAAAEAAGDSVYAVIHGSAVNSDGRSNGMVAPNARAQVACVRAAFARAEIDPSATQYVEAHGTGTRQGDPIELRALGTVLGEGRPEGEVCRVGSVKSNVGHSETAAGITGLIKAALCVSKRQLPPSLHCRQPNPSVDFAALKLEVQTALEPFPYPKRAAVVGVSSFGFGGTNAHVVLADAPRPSAPLAIGASMPLQLITLSARTPPALAALAAALLEQIGAQPSLELADLAASLNRGRTPFWQRAVCLAADKPQLMAQLRALVIERPSGEDGLQVGLASRRPGKLAWLVGAQANGGDSEAMGLGQELLAHPVFRGAFERASSLLDPHLTRPLALALINEPGLGEPVAFAVGYGLSQLWQSWGIQPDLLMGSGAGEVLAAHLAGVFSLEDAVRLVAIRAGFIQASAQELRQLRFAAPSQPLVSSRTGQLAGPEVAQSQYWCDQVPGPAPFEEGLATLEAAGAQAFLEIGGRPTWQTLATSLGGLWRRGFGVDWTGFHQPFPHRRVSVPGHPFDRQRYWWGRQGEAGAPASFWLDHLGIADQTKSQTKSQPLSQPGPPIERLERLELAGELAVYQAELPLAGSDLGDHRIRGQVVFPAAGFITAALAGLEQQGLPRALGNLRLEQPLKLNEVPAQKGAHHRLQVHYRPGALEFYNRSDAAEPGAWQLHGTACLEGVATFGAGDAPLALASPPPGAEPVDLEVLYGALAQGGLEYGPRFRGLARLQTAHGQAWAELKRPAGGHDRGLWDSCFQAVAVLLDPLARQGQLLLPVGLESLWLGQQALPDRFLCQVTLQPSAEPAFVLADLLLHNGAKPLAWIRGFRLRRLPRQALEWLFPLKQEEAHPSPGDWLFASSWQQAVASNDALGSQATAISPERIDLAGPIPAGIGPLLIWPDLAQPGATATSLCAQLLLLAQALAQAPARPVGLVLEGAGALAGDQVGGLAGALAGFARSAALEQPALGWTVLHLARGEAPARADWPALLALGQREPLLAWRAGKPWVQRIKPLADAPFRLASGALEAGALASLESLHQAPLRRQRPGPGELEIAVEATGLNFRDVLNALGLLAAYSVELGLDAGAQMPYGGECVGRVVAVGEGIDPALVGSRQLAALAVGSLASHVVCRSELCVPLPESMDPALGASVSTAFLTAIYGLQTLADLQPGETVLIHAAAGGVGQAALQVARRCGARVLATASAAKQAGLLAQGVEAVFDSRSLDFAEQVRAATAGRGVDVVLNSLKGDWVEASFAALAVGGRFVELGKIEIWSRLEAAQRRADARYLPFDLLEVAAAEPGLVRALLLELLDDLAAGRYTPIPLQTFPIERSIEAFRLMAQARHVGKVVITQAERPAPWSIQPQATYLVSGAFGGIGRQLCHWLAGRGARSLVLVGRRSDQALIDGLSAAGVACEVVLLDLAGGSPEPLVAALRGKPLAGVFHAAGVLDDGLLAAQTPGRQAAVIGSKWGGQLLLEQACQAAGCRPDFGVVFSSMASLLGSPGQTSYGAANGALDGLAAHHDQLDQRHRAWPTVSLQWGPWAGAGMAEGLERRFAALGVGLLPPERAFEALALVLERGRGGCVAVLNNDWPQLAAQLGHRQASVLEPLLQPLLVAAGGAQRDGAEGLALRRQLADLDAGQARAVVVGELRRRLAELMGLADAGSLDPGDSLFQLGLDSLMAVEWAAGIQRDLGVKLELESLAGDPTLEILAAVVLEGLGDSNGVGPEGGGPEGGERSLDLGQEAQLRSSWRLPAAAALASDPDAIACEIEPPGEAIVLTGASGFLGAYLLAGQLERWPQLQVRCLVRAQDGPTGLERIKANLGHYGLWQEAWASRLVAVPGDLAQPRFGLSELAFADLARGLGGILHNGAQLSQMASYGQLEAANVGGTHTVLELAVHGDAPRPVPIQLISSVAAFEAAAYRNHIVLESDDVAEWRGIHVGYSQTKWVSERLVLAAGAAGLPVSVYRPPLIGGHSRTGMWHQDDLLQRLLQGCLALGMAPDLPWELDLVPVDYVADAVTALAWMPQAVGMNYHLQHPQPMLLADLLNQLIAHGAPLQLVPMRRWIEAIAADPANPLHGIRAFFVRRWGEEQLTYPELNQAGIRARPSCTVTAEALAALGVRCPGFEALIGPYGRSLLTGVAL